MYALDITEKDALLCRACQTNLEQTELINTWLEILFHAVYLEKSYFRLQLLQTGVPLLCQGRATTCRFWQSKTVKLN